MISVCLATYNGARYLREQIDSILPQLNSGDELLIADDGSTDATLTIVSSYGEQLRLVASGRAGGVVANFERALAAASGDLIVLSDQDDVWLPGRLDLVREHLGGAALLMMNAVVVDADARPLGPDLYSMLGFHRGFMRTLIRTRYVGCCLALRRELLDLALPFPKRIQWHDWYLALIAELLFSVEVRPEKTLLFRRHDHNASPTSSGSRASLISRLQARLWMLHAIAVVLGRRIRGRPAARR